MPSLMSLGLDDEMGLEVKLPDKQRATVKQMQAQTTASIWGLAGAFGSIAAALVYLGWKKGR